MRAPGVALGARLRSLLPGDTERVTTLPHWPPGTVAILATEDGAPHAIPVSACLRAGDAEILLALARSRGSLTRLRERPRVAVALLARDLAFTAEGLAVVVADPLTEGTVAVAIQVTAVRDHDRPTFALEAGVAWRWTDAEARARDEAVRSALQRLVGRT